MLLLFLAICYETSDFYNFLWDLFSDHKNISSIFNVCLLKRHNESCHIPPKRIYKTVIIIRNMGIIYSNFYLDFDLI
jgi:hypothetical protein